MTEQEKIETLTAALKMAEGRFRDLGKLIEETGKYDNAGFMYASADRCLAALTWQPSFKRDGFGPIGDDLNAPRNT